LDSCWAMSGNFLSIYSGTNVQGFFCFPEFPVKAMGCNHSLPQT
jgi:hypothetical protein